MTSVTVESMREAYRRLGESVCERLQQEIDKLGLPSGDAVAGPCFEDAMFSIVVDPYSGEQDLTGYWYDAKRMKIGSLQFHAGGTFYAEYDVVKPHPVKPQWFVEGVSACGNGDDIKSEPRLLAAL